MIRTVFINNNGDDRLIIIIQIQQERCPRSEGHRSKPEQSHTGGGGDKMSFDSNNNDDNNCTGLKCRYV